MNRRLLWIVVGLALVGVLCVGGWIGLGRWRLHVQRQRDVRNLEEARKALGAGAWSEAERLHRDSRQIGFPNAHLVREWEQVELQLALGSEDPVRLLGLYQKDRVAVEANERASLALVRALNELGRREEGRALRERWRGRETARDAWLFLDVDGLLGGGKEGEAQRLLEGAKFLGDAEGMRLVRLARLTQSPKRVEALLDEALLAAPTNAFVLTARGRFYESREDARLAAFEYGSALALDPTDLGLREQAGDFLYRAGSVDSALAVWSAAPGGRTSESLWLKTWFWSRTVKPLPAGMVDPAVAGEWAPYVALLKGLPAGRWWDAEAAGRVTNGRELSLKRPELGLLELLDACARRDWAAVVEVTGRAGRKETLSAELENALHEYGTWRATGRVAAAPGRHRPVLEQRGDRHPLLVELDGLFHGARVGRRSEVKFPAGLAALAESDRLVPAILLAVGWPEAALRLTPEGALPGGVPELYVVEHGMALRVNRGAAAAEQFLSGARRGPAVDCARGEVLLALKQREEGRALLRPHAGLTNQHGMRAAYLLAVDALERGAPVEATGFLESNRTLASAVTGRELRAQIALAAGREEEAAKLFGALATESPLAARYLVERAKRAGDNGKALELVGRLSRRFPDNPELRLEWLELRRRVSGGGGGAK